MRFCYFHKYFLLFQIQSLSVQHQEASLHTRPLKGSYSVPFPVWALKQQQTCFLCLGFFEVSDEDSVILQSL